MSTSVAVSKTHTPRSLIANPSVREKVAEALPRFYTPDQFLVIVQTAINRNPKLEECTPESFMVALLTAAQMGVPVDGRHGHLIPRKNGKTGNVDCQFQADYKGLVRLVRMNDAVSDIYADLVCEADTFQLRKGLHRDIIHEVDIRQPRGPILGAYAVIQYKDGTPSFDFMQRCEIEMIRDRSDGWRAYKAGRAASSTWLTDEGEMFKKTVLKRLLKLADLSPDTTARLAMDTDAEVARLEPQGPTIQRASLPEINLPVLAQGDEEQTEPNDNTPAEKPAWSRRAAEKAKPAPEPTPAAEEETPLPGAEQEAPAPAEGLLSPVDKLRQVCHGYTDEQILKVLIQYRLAEPSMRKLESCALAKIEQALTDPDTLRAELHQLANA